MSEIAVKPPRLAETARHKVAKAIWWNWMNSLLLAGMLTLVGITLAYVIGWAIDVYVTNDFAPAGREPGLFLVRPDGTLYAASIQTMPFARPHVADVLAAVDYITKKAYPPRGEA